MSQGDGVEEKDNNRGLSYIKCWPPETGCRTGLMTPLMALTLQKCSHIKLVWKIMLKLITQQLLYLTNGSKQEQCLENKLFFSLDFQRSNKFNDKKIFVRGWVFCKEGNTFCQIQERLPGWISIHVLESCIMSPSWKLWNGLNCFRASWERV